MQTQSECMSDLQQQIIIVSGSVLSCHNCVHTSFVWTHEKIKLWISIFLNNSCSHIQFEQTRFNITNQPLYNINKPSNNELGIRVCWNIKQNGRLLLFKKTTPTLVNFKQSKTYTLKVKNCYQLKQPQCLITPFMAST